MDFSSVRLTKYASFFYFMILPGLSYTQDALDEYISEASYATGSYEVSENELIYFRPDAENYHWHKGVLVTSEGKSFKNVLLRYNLLEDYLEILHNETGFKLADKFVEKFFIYTEKGLEEFSKGFHYDLGAGSKSLIKYPNKSGVSFKGKSKEIDDITKLFEFIYSFKEIKILQTDIKHKGSKITGRIILKYSETTSFAKFINNLKKNSFIRKAEIMERFKGTVITAGPDPYRFNENDYFHVLYKDDIKLLKKNELTYEKVKDPMTGRISQQLNFFSHYFISDNSKNMSVLSLNKKDLTEIFSKYFPDKDFEELIDKHNLSFKKEEDLIKIFNLLRS